MTTQARYSGARLAFFDPTTFETLSLAAPITFSDDFMSAGQLVIPAAGSADPGDYWVKKLVGTPTGVAGVANAVGGQVACALAATSEKEDAVLYWGDQLGLDTTKGLVFETRFQLSVLPSAAGVQAYAGLASAWIDGINNNTAYAQLCATANGALLVRSFDGVTTVSAASGITVLTTDWVTLRINFDDLNDVKMFINGAQVTTAGQIKWAATGTLAVLQPFIGVYKPSGTGVASILTDYVKSWMNRV
jgi:hypothetical protein